MLSRVPTVLRLRVEMMVLILEMRVKDRNHFLISILKKLVGLCDGGGSLVLWFHKTVKLL